jgi:hypothetical protein
MRIPCRNEAEATRQKRIEKREKGRERVRATAT